MGFSNINKISFDRSKQLEFYWNDTSAPKIEDIKYSPSNWNSDKWIKIQAKVTDEDIKVISNVTLRYSTDGGDRWHEKIMIQTRDNVYEVTTR